MQVFQQQMLNRLIYMAMLTGFYNLEHMPREPTNTHTHQHAFASVSVHVHEQYEVLPERIVPE
jgi:hypothetical protein